MNPQIKLSVFAVWALLASTSCRLSCDALNTETETQAPPSPNAVETNARQLLDNIPTSNSPFHPLSPLPLRQNGPPLCAYPPPTTVTLPPPLHTPSPPLLGQPPYAKPEHSLWCVAKTNVPVSSLQQALDYACASGADCGPIQVNGLCYRPDTVLAHASYAFNSYWQKTKRAGGTCDFGGVAMPVTVDPSYDQCHFVYN